MAKIVDLNPKAKIKKGVDTLSNAVKVTLGPRGRNVILEKSYAGATITKDGVSVAREIQLEDPLENLGAQVVKEAASKTADIAGDGTTTATVLAQAILSEGYKIIDQSNKFVFKIFGKKKSNIMEIKRGIESGLKYVIDFFEEKKKSIGDDKEVYQIAAISANNDTETGDLIAQAVLKAGKEGTITVEEGRTRESKITSVDGIRFDRGLISPYFSTNKVKIITEFDKPFFLLTDNKITNLQTLLPILNDVLKQNRPLVIMCDELDGSALEGLILNVMKQDLPVAAIKAPGFGDRRKELLEDLATALGGKAYLKDSGMELSKIKLDDLGQSDKVTITKDNTTIYGFKGSPTVIEFRKEQLRNLMEDTKNEMDKGKLAERLAKLTGGICVIQVGASTDVEMKEKKDRIDDALSATKAAIAEGILPGGGIAFLRAAEYLKQNKIKFTEKESKEFITGYNILIKALGVPFKQIMENGGFDYKKYEKLIIQGAFDYGFNGRTGKMENLYESGVIDPAKVSRVALENAVSVASLLLTTEAVVAINPNHIDPMAAMGGMPQM